jgi:hypothetical protein
MRHMAREKEENIVCSNLLRRTASVRSDPLTDGHPKDRSQPK